MYFYFIVILQGFCIYHMYKNRNKYYWFFIIIFLPVLGSIIYLITHVYNKQDAEKIQNEITIIINPTKKIKDLERKLQFSETYQNRVNLADAYFELNDFQNAILHYKESIDNTNENDYYVIKQLINSFYEIEDFKSIIYYSEKVRGQIEFKNSRIQFLYGLALENIGKVDEAEKQLREIDTRYSNYEERLILAKFLLKRSKVKDAREILNDVFTESKHMTKPNRRIYRTTIEEVERLISEI